jgi:hypothetical protein
MKPLTPYEREIVADIFKKAKAIFEEGGCDYICTALRGTHTYRETLKTSKPTTLPSR